MGDGTHGNEPKISPPPRIQASPDRAPGDDRSAGGGPIGGKRLIGRAAVGAAMLVGLVLVFVFLPRWHEERQERLATDGEATETVAPPFPPATSTPEPAPTTFEAGGPSGVPATATPVREENPAPRVITPRARRTEEKQRFIQAMSEALAALDRRQWEAALLALDRASRLKPDAPEVADGIARARAGQRRETIADGIRAAQNFEEQESWREAERAYSAVLAIDPESAQALVGQRRTEARSALDEKIEYHLANPGRLSTDKVFSDASSALDQALETVPSGPRLESQIARLERLLEHVSTPVEVVLESDDLTEVTVYRVGRLGTFSRHRLNLKPGAYTVVGSRSGYRDVRLQLVVTPGSTPDPLVVRCTERL